MSNDIGFNKNMQFFILVLLPCAEQRVDLIDEDDGGLVHPRHSKQGANHLLPLAHPLAKLKKIPMSELQEKLSRLSMQLFSPFHVLELSNSYATLSIMNTIDLNDAHI